MEHSVLNKILDDKNFTVGGGASSALMGAMAAGMIAMVANLSTKKDYGLSVNDYEDVSSKCNVLRDRLLQGAVLDEKAFCMLRDAYRSSKDTDEQKRKRSQAIQDGAVKAAEVPRDNGLMCKSVHELGQKLLNRSNPNAISDLEIAIDMSELGVNGCIKNIEANLPIIKDSQIVGEFERDLERLKIKI